MKFISKSPSKMFLFILLFIFSFVLMAVVLGRLVHHNRYCRMLWFSFNKNVPIYVLSSIMKDSWNQQQISEMNQILISNRNLPSISYYATHIATGMLRTGDNRYLPFITYIAMDSTYSSDQRLEAINSMNLIQTTNFIDILKILHSRTNDGIRYEVENILNQYITNSISLD